MCVHACKHCDPSHRPRPRGSTAIANRGRHSPSSALSLPSCAACDRQFTPCQPPFPQAPPRPCPGSSDRQSPPSSLCPQLFCTHQGVHGCLPEAGRTPGSSWPPHRRRNAHRTAAWCHAGLRGERAREGLKCASKLSGGRGGVGDRNGVRGL